ncbi:hypothetical protein O9992_00240 [Vibrio lentus]|nr:hypothetical protein [Vibrio lentus]
MKRALKFLSLFSSVTRPPLCRRRCQTKRCSLTFANFKLARGEFKTIAATTAK